MSAEDDGFFESASTGFGSQLRQRKQRIDLVSGSGKRGQTYLYWEGDRLWELPVSYWTDGHRWINSPGYADGTADFLGPCIRAAWSATRLIYNRCRLIRKQIGSTATA